MFQRQTIILLYSQLVIYATVCLATEPGVDGQFAMIFQSLMNYTRDQLFGIPIDITFSKSFIQNLYQPSQYKLIGFYSVIPKLEHIDELCPNDRDECWCAISSEPTATLDFTGPTFLLKICSTLPLWKKDKARILEKSLLSFVSIQYPNGTLHKDFQRQAVIKKLNSYEKVQFDPEWLNLNYNKHDANLCPPRLGWCWCGIIGNPWDYTLAKRSISIVNPMVTVDCRPQNERLYEERDCKPESYEKLPWHRKLFGPPANAFPCGHY